MVNIFDNVAGADADYYTWEVTAHQAHARALVDARGVLENLEQAQNGCGSSNCGTTGATFFGTQFRQNALPVTPNDLINTEPDGKINYTDWSFKLHGTHRGAATA